MANIFSLTDMTDKHRITFDSDSEQAFIVHTPGGPMHFNRVTSNLYDLIPSNVRDEARNQAALALFQTNPQIPGVNLMKTVAQRKIGLTPQQLKRADQALSLLKSLAYPTIEDLKTILKSNMIKDNPVTEDDLRLAITAYGDHLDGAALKGKITRQKPIPVRHNTVSIPPELVETHRNIELCVDGMYVNNLAFITTIDTTGRYRTAQYVPNRILATYKSALANVLHIYNCGGFKVPYINADLEFKPLLEFMKSTYGFTPNYATTNEHVPAAEHNNRTASAVVVKYLVLEVRRKLNFFPAKGGISTYYSPRAILHHRAVDYSSQCTIPPLAYVLAHKENNPANTQGGHEVYSLPESPF
eukprot:scaffold13397_cov183-Amphora_coffeaeformis.AAC.7